MRARASLYMANYSCNYFRTNPTHTPTVHQRHGQTDGRTDGRLTIAIPRFALRAPRSKNDDFVSFQCEPGIDLDDFKDSNFLDDPESEMIPEPEILISLKLRQIASKFPQQI